MWTVIDSKNENSYFSKYPILKSAKELFVLYRSESKIILPRFFYYTFPSDELRLINTNYEPDRINFTCSITPRKMQSDVADIVLKQFNETGQVSGIIKARPGSGKTILAVYLASLLKYKTLIIVDSQALQKQWIREIFSVTDLTPNDVGIIRQKLFPEGHEKIVVATVQTLVRQIKKDPKDIYTRLKNHGYGLAFFDECHKSSSSEQYGKVTSILPMDNILGLSATPYPKKEQEILMKNTIGDIIFENRDYDYQPEINFIFYKSGLDKYRFVLSKMHEYLQRKAYYNKIICNSEKYLNSFVKFVSDDLKDKHKVIIICQTEKQVLTISETLTKAGIKNTQYYGKEREFDKSDNVLVATYAFAGTGFDFKELSSLIYACPLCGKISLIQTAGRILRTCENKIQPRIRYLVDMTFPSESLTEYKYAKKVFQGEFSESKMIEMEM